ncbi:MAG: 5-(carboxyamino)imidazole ribonucleotide mutase [Clostridiales bacterium]|nr:5-(carboxyamino)imidazole ribonucleotide mutase [Clostridiales bacterium]
MLGCLKTLQRDQIPYEIHIISAHRTPEAAAVFSSSARENGFGVLIAAAGKAAHLAGILAAHTTLPVIAVPIKSSTLDGLDALLSSVQMPKGVPVATVAIDGGDNAAILAEQILGVFDAGVAERLSTAKENMKQEIQAKDQAIAEQAQAMLDAQK